MKKFYDIEIDSQVELENGKTLGKLEESKISVNDGNCVSGGGNNFLITIPSITDPLTQDATAQLNVIKKFILDNSDNTGFFPTESFSIICVAADEIEVVGTYNCNLQTEIVKSGNTPAYNIGIIGQCVDNINNKAYIKFIEFDTAGYFSSDGTYTDSEWTFKTWEKTIT